MALKRLLLRPRIDWRPAAGSLHALLTLALLGHVAGAAPSVFWHSDPVRPGETVLVIGGGLTGLGTVEVTRLPEGAAGKPGSSPFRWAGGRLAEVLSAEAGAVKFVLPASEKPGVFAYRIGQGAGAAVGLLNRPTIWWVQGDLGADLKPGGTLRLFGKNLGSPGASTTDTSTPVTLWLEGKTSVALKGQATCWAAKADLPTTLPPGSYRVFVHNGSGGSAAWSEPASVTVRQPTEWPQTVFNVRECGATGEGSTRDAVGIVAALKKAEENGGGVVYFPRGRYRLTGMLQVPRFTVLRGERRESVCLFWPDFPDPPEALIRGTNSFGLEDLTLYAANHRHVIAGDLGSEPEAGNVFLRRVRVRADAYRAHLKPEELDARLRASLKLSTGGGDTVRVGGPNIEIGHCDLYGSGRSLFLHHVRGGWVHDCSLYNGRWGWYCISGSEGLIFEGNTLTGGDLMSTGGGLNCLYGSTHSENVYFAHNQFRRLHGWDREAMTSDAGGEAYVGKVQQAAGTTLTLADDANWGTRDWQGAGVFILQGRGAGQYRRVVRGAGRTVELDRAFDVPPDAESVVSVTMFQGRYVLVGNEFTDTGALQFYGTSIENVVAGNRGARMKGFRGLGLWYHGYQPSWFCQFLDNTIDEGNYYHWTDASDAVLEISGARRGDYQGPLNRGAVVRRNHLSNNAHLHVAGTCRDVLVEGNRIDASELGIYVSNACQNVLVRGNQFHDVTHEQVDEAGLRKAAEERIKEFLGRQEPVGLWKLTTLTEGLSLDSSGNGFHAVAVGGVSVFDDPERGPVTQFDGTGYLRVEETAVFNAPSMTIALWVKAANVKGRRGLVTKRFSGGVAPAVLGYREGRLTFEATELGGPWTFNFIAPAQLVQDQWHHVAVTIKAGEGVTLYLDGKAVATKQNAAPRETNNEPLIIGREAWGGDPPTPTTPGFFVGALSDLRLWTRALSAAEVRAAAQPPE